MAGIGIENYTTIFGSQYVTSKQLSKKSGIPEDVFIEKLNMHGKPVSSSTETPLSLAFSAVQRLLDSNPLNLDSIELVIYASNGLFDHYMFSPAAKIAHRFNLKKAFAFEVNNGCNAALLALNIASKMLPKGSEKYALIITSDTVSKHLDYKDQSLFPFFICGDAASAILIKQNSQKMKIIESAFSTNGELSDCAHLKQAGTNHLNQAGILKAQNTIQFNTTHLPSVDFLKNKIIEGYIHTIEKILIKRNLKNHMINFWCINQNSKNIIDSVFKYFKVKSNQYIHTAPQYGHLPNSDIFIALKLAIKQNKIKKNDTILLASCGIGYHWGAMLVTL